LSPEAINEPEQVDARSDLYAVGAVGYFLLTGKPVFEGRHVMEICSKHLNEAPLPPSQRLGRAVSPELERVLLACLAKTPADRPASAVALAAALTSCKVGESWSKHQAAQWVGRGTRRGER
jgi:serine/threonine protein kinase